ncbi:hypothetical protein BJ508DRAFT_411317 [Ascobolus immersus RN42]|uniref:Mitochondrial distribution and morphology protein 12 n=1 Tax=Ascobolus immersus RN42 TaxID=1160509 RepID=A0A3N4IJ03_ASCIM|nr:hypothetical protein BJ508DRAFT_411317 [Ascobolus immersus RN42]
MSVEISWENLTSGEEGKARAAHIRDFIHAKFQNVPLPRFIQSVKVVNFDFGSVPPEVEIKDICDPYPEFYEEEFDDEEETNTEDEEDEMIRKERALKRERERRRRERKAAAEASSSTPNPGGPPATPSRDRDGQPPPYQFSETPSRLPALRPAFTPGSDALRGPAGVATPLFASGPSSHLHYFHSALSSTFPQQSANGSQTPNNRPYQSRSNNYSDLTPEPASPDSDRATSPPLPRVSSPLSPTPNLGTALPLSLPFFPPSFLQSTLSQSHTPLRTPRSPPPSPGSAPDRAEATTPPPRLRLREPSDSDLQIKARVRYTGDIKIELTAELLLDYPSASFVGLPVRIVVTGFTFDGMLVVASIRKQLHVCFVDEDDDDDSIEAASTASGPTKFGSSIYAESSYDGDRDGLGAGIPTSPQTKRAKRKVSMIKDIKVESEIGEKGKTKQVLKNVGKVERFVLEQIRRVFEDEMVFPSSWTFLI